MGILNVTPDSFSDGGEYLDPLHARQRLTEIVAQGAAICDVGAESTRPGALPVPLDEELRRLAPVFDAMVSSDVGPVSVDTTKAVVAERAIDCGAVLVNDVTAGLGDPGMLPLVAERGTALCLMHMRGTPRTMQDAPRYADVVAEVCAFLEDRMAAAVRSGVAEDHILLDPGIGFGKRLEDNLALIHGLPKLVALGRPVLVGSSRKRMFARLLGREDPGDRMAGSLASALFSVQAGVAVVRVHDVVQTVDALATWRAIEEAK